METERIRYFEDKVFAIVNLFRNKGYLTTEIDWHNSGRSVPRLKNFVTDGEVFTHRTYGIYHIGIVIPIQESSFDKFRRKLFYTSDSPYVVIADASNSSILGLFHLDVYGRRYVPYMQDMASEIIGVGWNDVSIELKSEETPQLAW